MKKREAKAIRKSAQFFVYLILAAVLLGFIGYSLFNSLFFKRPDRINVVFYSEKTALYSWGKTDNINYFTYLYPDLKVLVPGGYGYYRVGALGKLISLEKKPELMTRAFSTATSSFVNYYFYPQGEKIYYGGAATDTVFFPTFKQIWLNASNANILDRFYLWLMFALGKKADFAAIDTYPIKSKQEQRLLDESALGKRYQGFFYHKTYRNEKKSVQIIYTKEYNSAVVISRILGGVGIRVVDISQEEKQPKDCTITEVGEGFSQTAKDLAHFFNCKIVKAKTRLSDIILELGSQESAWRGE